MHKRIFKGVAFIAVIVTMVMALSSCGPKYETITQNPGNYKYGIGEKAEIKDIETGNEIAELEITSCKLVYDKPFIVVEKESSDDDDFKEYKYTAMYKLEYKFEDNENRVNNVSAHFRSRDNNFNINPTGEEELGVLYVGARKGNNGDDTVTLGFSYDTFQIRDTATFEIKLDKVVKEKSFDDCEVIVAEERGRSVDRNDDDGIGGFFAVIAMIFGFLLIAFILAAPILGIIGFANSVSLSRKLKIAYEKIRQLEYMINSREYGCPSVIPEDVELKDEKG